MAAEQTPHEMLAHSFLEICGQGGTDVALAHLIAHQRQQGLNLRVLLAYANPRGVPPLELSGDVLDEHEAMVREIQLALERATESEDWLLRAAGTRQRITSMLGRKAPPAEGAG